jgi:O-antigen/teichoic acid export membrane protein
VSAEQLPSDPLTAATAGGRVIRGSAWRVVANGAGIVLGLGTARLLLGHLSVPESGQYVTVLSLVSIAVYVADIGLNVAGSRELALRGPQDRTLIANLLGQRLLVMPAAVALLVVFALLAGYRESMVVGTALAGAGALLTGLANVPLLRLTVELRNAGLALVDFVKQAVGLAGVALLVALGSHLTPFFGVLIVVGIVVVALLPVLLGPGAFVWPRFDRDTQRALFVTAFPMAAAIALGQVYFRLVIVLMSLISNETQTGYYGASLRAIEGVLIIPVLVSGVALPLLSAAARDDMARLRFAVRGLGEGAVIAGVFVILVAFRLTEPVMVLLGRAKFGPAGPVLRIQVATLLFLALDQIWTASLLALGRQRELILTNALALVGVAIFAGVLVPRFGAEGGAEASVAGEMFLAALIYWRLSRAAGRVIAGPGFFVRVLVAAAVASVALVIPGLPSLPAAALAGAAFLGVGQLIGMVPEELHEALLTPQLLGVLAPAAAGVRRLLRRGGDD